MNWLKNFKDKIKDTSTKLVSDYKQGLGEFVTSLNNDLGTILPSKSDGKEGQAGPLTRKPNNTIDVSQAGDKNYFLLKEVLETVLPNHRSILIDDIEKAVAKVEKQDYYLRKDPLNLVLLERDDFTNFTVFYETFQKNSEIIEKLLTYDPLLPGLIVNDQYQTNSKEGIHRFLFRYLYLVVYYLETQNKQATTTTTTTSSSTEGTTTTSATSTSNISQSVENAVNIEVSTSGADNQVVQQQSDSPLKKSTVSSPDSPLKKTPLSSASSFTEIKNTSSSSEEEKNFEGKSNGTISDKSPDELPGTEKKPLHKESDDWQIEDSTIII